MRNQRFILLLGLAAANVVDCRATPCNSEMIGARWQMSMTTPLQCWGFQKNDRHHPTLIAYIKLHEDVSTQC